MRRIDRDSILLTIREAGGEWVFVSSHCSRMSAHVTTLRWRNHCKDTKWVAFEFMVKQSTGGRSDVVARFVGTLALWDLCERPSAPRTSEYQATRRGAVPTQQQKWLPERRNGKSRMG